jgi:hypothetical protein
VFSLPAKCLRTPALITCLGILLYLPSLFSKLLYSLNAASKSRSEYPGPQYQTREIPSYPIHSNSNSLPIVLSLTFQPIITPHPSATSDSHSRPQTSQNPTFISISPPSSLNTPHSSFLPQFSLTPHSISLSLSLLHFLSFLLGSKQEKSPDNTLARDCNGTMLL